MHPSQEIFCAKSKELEGKTIVLAVTSSISAVKTIELARELIRHGATVLPAMSREARKIIHPNSLEYATGNKPVTELTGQTEHIDFFGEKGKADLLVIAPCTANTVGKIAAGIADDAITTIALAAMGSRKPVLIVPAMHQNMMEHPIVKENMEKLRQTGVQVIQPLMEEGTAKLLEKEQLLLEVQKALSEKKLEGKKILIVSGRTEESIDDARVITNKASGKTGIEIAKECYKQGAQVKLMHNNLFGFQGIEEEKATTAEDFYKKTLSELEQGYDWVMLPAAIGDFAVAKAKGKIDSSRTARIELKPRKKLVQEIREKFPHQKVVAFKAVANVSKQELKKIALQKLKKEELEMVVANDIAKGGMGTEDNKVWIVTKKAKKWVEGKKSEIAKEITKHM